MSDAVRCSTGVHALFAPEFGGYDLEGWARRRRDTEVGGGSDLSMSTCVAPGCARCGVNVGGLVLAAAVVTGAGLVLAAAPVDGKAAGYLLGNRLIVPEGNWLRGQLLSGLGELVDVRRVPFPIIEILLKLVYHGG